MNKFTLLSATCTTLLILAACGGTDADITPASAPVDTPPEVVDALPAIDLPYGNTDIETWRIIGDAIVADAAVNAPDGFHKADRITFSGDRSGVIKQYFQTPINAGNTLTATATFWSSEPVDVSWQIVRSCGTTPAESETVRVVVTPEPQTISVSKTFENDHACVQAGVISTASGASVNIYDVYVR